MYKFALSFAAAMLLAACASQPSAATHQQTLSQALQQAGGTAQVQGPEENGQKLICTTGQTALGSHLSHTVCLTPEQEAERQKQAQQSMQQIQHQSTLCSGGPTCVEP